MTAATASVLVGLPVAMSAQITDRHIEQGAPCVGDACALVLAVRDALRSLGYPEPVSITANSHDIEIVGTWRTPHVTYHHNAGEFVRRFDACQPVQPRNVYLWRPGREYQEAPAA